MSAMHDMQLSGWRIRSEFPLKGLVACLDDDSRFDIEMICDASAGAALDGAEGMRVVASNCCHLQVPSVGRFTVTDGARVTCLPAQDASAQALTTLLLGPVFAVLLCQAWSLSRQRNGRSSRRHCARDSRRTGCRQIPLGLRDDPSRSEAHLRRARGSTTQSGCNASLRPAHASNALSVARGYRWLVDRPPRVHARQGESRQVFVHPRRKRVRRAAAAASCARRINLGEITIGFRSPRGCSSRGCRDLHVAAVVCQPFAASPARSRTSCACVAHREREHDVSPRAGSQ